MVEFINTHDIMEKANLAYQAGEYLEHFNREPWDKQGIKMVPLPNEIGVELILSRLSPAGMRVIINLEEHRYRLISDEDIYGRDFRSYPEALKQAIVEFNAFRQYPHRYINTEKLMRLVHDSERDGSLKELLHRTKPRVSGVKVTPVSGLASVTVAVLEGSKKPIYAVIALAQDRYRLFSDKDLNGQDFETENRAIRQAIKNLTGEK